MNFFKKSLMLSIILGIGISTLAVAIDSSSYSGYFVSRIIDKTIILFVQTNLLSPYSKTATEWNKYWEEAVDQEQDGMLPTFPFIDFEQSLLYFCINKGFMTNEQASIIIEKSKKVGGLTINGYNLLYLHAEILDILVKDKYITKEEAQNMLDSSREKN